MKKTSQMLEIAPQATASKASAHRKNGSGLCDNISKINLCWINCRINQVDSNGFLQAKVMLTAIILSGTHAEGNMQQCWFE